METIPTTSPFSTTGRWRNPLSSIVFIASSTSTSGLTVFGSRVIHDEISWVGASYAWEMARTVSRSVKMPMSRPASMISADPILFRAINEIASPTVVEGSTE